MPKKKWLEVFYVISCPPESFVQCNSLMRYSTCFIMFHLKPTNQKWCKQVPLISRVKSPPFQAPKKDMFLGPLFVLLNRSLMEKKKGGHSTSNIYLHLVVFNNGKTR